jgi:dihydrofolate reductase
LPRRPLPGRVNIVMTDDPCECIDDCISSYSVEDALSKCPGDREVFVIGGGMVYRQFMEIADRLYITHVHKEFEADTFFPEIDPLIWKEVDREDHDKDEATGFSYSYVTYLRR